VPLDDRTIYFDFFGIVRDCRTTSDIRQLEVPRPGFCRLGRQRSPVSSTSSEGSARGAGHECSAERRLVQPRRGSGLRAPERLRGHDHVAGAEQPLARRVCGYSTLIPRPTGQIRDPGSAPIPATVGGAQYPVDGTGPTGTAFANRGTSQPKFDARVDQEISGGRITYAGGIAGSQGIIHTGIGPFDIQNGSYMGYGKVNYQRGTVKVNFFTNLVNPSVTAAHRSLARNRTAQPRRRPPKWGPRHRTPAAPRVQLRRRHRNARHHHRRRTPKTTNSAPRAGRNPPGPIRRSAAASAVQQYHGAVFATPPAISQPRDDHAITSFSFAFRSPSVVNNYSTSTSWCRPT
jgi:hypothetical protein